MTGHDGQPILTRIVTIVGNWSRYVPIMTTAVDQRKQVKIHGLVMMTSPQPPNTLHCVDQRKPDHHPTRRHDPAHHDHPPTTITHRHTRRYR